MAMITYLLGAGASAEALPVVAKLNDRLIEFQDLLSNKLYKRDYFDAPLWEGERVHIPLLDSLSHVIAENEKHYSIDTYAKKLFLNGSNEEYVKLKAVLVCFFMYLQMRRDMGLYVDENNELVGSIRIDERLQLEDKKQKVRDHYLKFLDKRYDAFFAALLKKSNDGLVLPDEVNIISWNYDSQFELSYAGFADKGINNLSDNFDEIVCKLRILSRDNDGTQTTNPKLIKLNGSTRYVIDGEKSSDYYNEVLTDMSIFHKIYEDVISLKGDFFNFAWESNPANDVRVELAKEIVKNSDVLVIIGYTFPYYNMEVDKAIFGNKRFSSVYIQDLPDKMDALVDRLGYFGIERKIIKPVIQTDLFFIPPEYIGSPTKRDVWIAGY